MINQDPIDVSEDLELLLKQDDAAIDYKELIKKLEECHAKYCHKNYDHFSISLFVEGGKSGLVFVGLRKENTDETKKRVAIEESKQKQAEEAELKTYLRLHKKYSKKGE